MRARCPHCKSINEGNKGDLVRCSECKKVFEVCVAIKEKKAPKTNCPSCKAENKGEVGTLVRCQSCNKVFEVAKQRTALSNGDRAQASTTPRAPSKPCPYCAETILEKAIKCKHCGEMLVEQVESEPEQTTEPPNTGNTGVSGTGIIFLIFIVLWGIGKCSDSKPNKQKADDTLAYLTCEQAVENKLKAPRSADFAGYGNSQIRQSGKTFVIDSYVDAQNSFGAKVRTRWSCSATYKSGDPYASSNWSINAVTR